MSRLFRLGATVAMGAPVGAPFPLDTTDFCQTARFLKKLGYDSMEIHIRAPSLVDGPKIKECCDQIGMVISTIGTGQAYGMEGLSITSHDVSICRAAVRRLKDQMDLGKIFHCPVIIGSMRGGIKKGETHDAVHRRMIDSMKELAEYAEATGTEIVVEAINRFETNYLNTASDVLNLITAIGSTRLFVHLDTFHMNLEEKDWRMAILGCKDRLGHVHVADNNRNYPGWGLIDFQLVLTYLHEVGYDKSLTLECYPVPDGITALKRGRQYLDGLMDAMTCNSELPEMS